MGFSQIPRSLIMTWQIYLLNLNKIFNRKIRKIAFPNVLSRLRNYSRKARIMKRSLWRNQSILKMTLLPTQSTSTDSRASPINPTPPVSMTQTQTTVRCTRSHCLFLNYKMPETVKTRVISLTLKANRTSWTTRWKAWRNLQTSVIDSSWRSDTTRTVTDTAHPECIWTMPTTARKTMTKYLKKTGMIKKENI